MLIALGMKEARLRLRGDSKNPLGLCLNCGKSLTGKGSSGAKEINSCGAEECNKECKKVFRWVRGVMRSLNSSVSGAYVNYQMGQGGL
jgi:hypothetical protein